MEDVLYRKMMKNFLILMFLSLAVLASASSSHLMLFMKTFDAANCTGSFTNSTVRLYQGVHGKYFIKAPKSSNCTSGIEICTSKVKDRFHHRPYTCFCHCRCYEENKCINYHDKSFALVSINFNASHIYNGTHNFQNRTHIHNGTWSHQTTAKPTSATSTTSYAPASPTVTTASPTVTTTLPPSITFCVVAPTNSCKTPNDDANIHALYAFKSVVDGACTPLPFNYSNILFNGAMIISSSVDCKTVSVQAWRNSQSCGGASDFAFSVLVPVPPADYSCGDMSQYFSDLVSFRLEGQPEKCQTSADAPLTVTVAPTSNATTTSSTGNSEAAGTATATSDSSSSSGGLPWWVMVLIAVIVLGICAMLGAVAFVAHRMAKPSSTTPGAIGIPNKQAQPRVRVLNSKPKATGFGLLEPEALSEGPESQEMEQDM